MANYYQPPPQSSPYGASGAGAANANPQNLQFYSSTYSGQAVSGHTTPFQAQGGSFGAASPGASYGQGYGGAAGGGYGFGAAAGVSGRMGTEGGLRTGWIAAFSTEGYEGEPPLMEELGVNFGHIKMKTLTVLNPMGSIDQHIMDDADLAGPIIFCLLFGFFLLFSGKVHFGYIYGLALLGSFALHFILSLMSPPPDDAAAAAAAASGAVPGSGHFASTLTFTRSASVLGYCMLPLVLTSSLGIGVSMDGPFGYALTCLAIAWCTWSSSAMFCAVGRMHAMRGLVAYPLMLFYVGFGIMGIFSSRGSSAKLANAPGVGLAGAGAL